jgi:hypothetical protein
MRIIYRYVLVFIDRLFKMRHFVSTIFMKVEKAVNSFYQNVWKLHDLSDALTFDRDTQFIFDFWELMCKRLKIDVRLSISFHLEIDEQIERVNAIMKHYFWAYVNYMQNDWAQYLSSVEFVSNNINAFSILVFFFLINHEQYSRVEYELEKFLSRDLTAQDRVNLIVVNQFVNKMKNVNDHLCDEMLIAQASYEVIVNENRCFCFRYLVNDMIWLNTQNIQIARSAIKLNDRHVDSYRVSKVFSNSLVVQLKLSDTINVHLVFHVNFLQHDVNDSLLEQISKSREFVIAEDDQRE